jgi:hypothetical protein
VLLRKHQVILVIDDGKWSSWSKLGGQTLILSQGREIIFNVYSFMKIEAGQEVGEINCKKGGLKHVMCHIVVCEELWWRLESRETANSSFYHLAETDHTRNLRDLDDIDKCVTSQVFESSPTEGVCQ